MSEKVLGVPKEYAFIRESISRGRVYPEKITSLLININKEYLVPVRLASESVDLKALKDICKNIEIDFDNDKYNQFSYPRTLEEVIERAEKEAKKK